MACALVDGLDGCLDDPFPEFPQRGWSMRRGHRKAIEARTLRKSQSSSSSASSANPKNAGLGRSSVKRSVNRSSRRFWNEMSCSGKVRSRQLREEVFDASNEHRRNKHEFNCSVQIDAVDVIETYLSFEHLAPLTVSKETLKEVDDLEVASVCTTATGSSGSDISMHLQMQSCRSPWAAAVLRASIVASCYKFRSLQQEKSEKSKKEKEKQLTAEEKYLAELSQDYQVQFSYDLKDHLKDRLKASCRFEKFRAEFFYKNSAQFLRQLQPLYTPQSATWRLRPTPVSQQVQKQFWERTRSIDDEKLLMVFHGTNEKSLGSIYSDGLVVPGLENSIRVANGSAYGVGIYAGKADNAGISWSYSRGESRPMLVCAAWDGPAEEVFHHPSFNVFKTNHSVVPLFEATLPDLKDRLPGSYIAPAPPPVRKKRRIIVPDAKKPKGPGPQTKISRPVTGPAVVVFLSRRAADKRRGTAKCG